MRKTFFLILSLFLLSTVNLKSQLVSNPASHNGAGLELELDWVLSTQSIEPGENVEVTVSLKNYDNVSITGIIGMQIEVLLDVTKVVYVASSAQTLATVNVGDLMGNPVYNQGSQKIIFLYTSFGSEELSFPYSNIELFKFTVKALSDITEDTQAIFTCTKFAVSDDRGNRKIEITNNPFVDITIPSSPTGLESNVASNTKAWSEAGRVFINVPDPASVKIYTVTGILIAELNVEKEVNIALHKGIYIIKSVSENGTETMKIIND